MVKFFSEIGFEVVRIAGFKCGSATDIAHVPELWCEEVVTDSNHTPCVAETLFIAEPFVVRT